MAEGSDAWEWKRVSVEMGTAARTKWRRHCQHETSKGDLNRKERGGLSVLSLGLGLRLGPRGSTGAASSLAFLGACRRGGRACQKARTRGLRSRAK